MPAAVGQFGEDLHGAVLDGRGQVLYRHRRYGRPAQPGLQVLPGAGGVADFQPADGGDPDQAALDAASPVGCVRAVGEADEGGLVDQQRRSSAPSS